MNTLSPEKLEEIRQRNQKAKDVDMAKPKNLPEHSKIEEDLENAGFVKAAFHVKDGADEMVWLKVIKVSGDRVQGAIYRKPERVTFKVGESVVVRIKDIIETRERISGPINQDKLERYFPL
jgi:uncharacterized protein YegJ (DUF2314 family)